MTEQKQSEAIRLALFCRAISRGLLVKPYIEDLNAAASLLEHQHSEITSLRQELDTQREWSKKMFNDQEEIIEGLTTLLVSYGKPYKEGDTERELWLVEKRFKPHVAAGGGAVLRVFGDMREELK